MITKKSTLIFLILFSIFHLQGQEVLDISCEVIKKNKIYKCIERTSHDSLKAHKDTSSGLYVIFDSEGRKIEQNTENGIGQTIVHYMYNDLGQQSMFVWYDENSVPKINRVHIYNYDEKGKKIGYCDWRPNYESKCDSLTQYFNHSDTIYNPKNNRTIVMIEYRDKNMEDTVFKFLQYYNDNRLDSTKLFDFTNKRTEIELVIHNYSATNIKLSEKLIRYDKKQILSRKESYYLPNGLLDYVESRYKFYSSTKKTWLVQYSKSTFDYYYWK